MHSIFSPNSKFMILMGYLADLMILNILYLISCIPVVTVGIATTALYSACFQLRSGAVVKCYLRSFRENWKQGLVLGCILLAFQLFLIADVLLLYPIAQQTYAVYIVFFVLLVLVTIVGCYLFPLLSLFRNSTLGTLKNAFVLAVGRLPVSLLITGINLIPFFVLFFHTQFFIKILFIWLLLWFSAAAYANTFLIKKALPDVEKNTQ